MTRGKSEATLERGRVKDAECVVFLQWALPRMRMRWHGFRKVRGQVRKRLTRRLRELELDSLDTYRQRLGEQPVEWAALERICRITISRFYRDRAVFEALEATVLPTLEGAAHARGGRAIRAWSAGCASGEEPYSLRLAWEFGVSRDTQGLELEIVATEVDGRLLQRARAACYARGTLKDLPSAWIAAGFDPVGDELCLRPGLRDRVVLLRQDIRHGMPSGPFHLVLCRNLVFTYFQESLQALLLERMLRRLASDGLLILGAHEALPPGSWPLVRPFGALPIHRLSEASTKATQPRAISPGG